MQAVVAGGTGLVGSALLDLLDAEGVPTRVLGRRTGTPRRNVLWTTLDLRHTKAANVPAGTDVAFCALGTTIKAAGSQDAFRAVDHGLVLSFARACRKAGVPTFVAVSAAGADAASRIFYNRVKGETEADLAALGFPSLTLVRPSLLMGERAERRPLEKAGIGVFRALSPLLPRSVRGVTPRQVAEGMLAAARVGAPGVRILRNADLLREP